MTIGGSSAWMVPSSGIVTWKSESASSRKASNGSSVRSSSSIRSTGAPPSCGCIASSSGRRIRNRSENSSSVSAWRSAEPSASAVRIATICAGKFHS